jgi:putative dimethyl sulfoxide reductase chaperone
VTEIALFDRLGILADFLERMPRQPITLYSPLFESGELLIEPSDEMAAEHYQALCHELMPAASVFLEPGGMMGGSVSNSAWTFMAEYGYEPDTSSILADHLSSSLQFIRFLIEKGQFEQSGIYLNQEVLSWLPPFLDRLKTFQYPLMAQLSLAVEDLVEAVQRVSGGRANTLASAPTTFRTLHQTSFNIEEEGTSLAAIGEFLATHAESGLYILKSRLASEARLHPLPNGFGLRARTIEGMLRSAAQYDGLDAVCDFFDAEILAHRTTWEVWSSKGASHWAKAWTSKLAATSAVVSRLRRVTA